MLSLGRNLVKSLQGIEVCLSNNTQLPRSCLSLQSFHLKPLALCICGTQGAAETLEQLWISYNQVRPEWMIGPKDEKKEIDKVCK